MLKMVMLVFNEAVELEILEVLEQCGVKNYTKIPETYGRGTTSGGHEGNDIWPGRNTIFYVACPEENAKKMLDAVRGLRKTLGEEGVKAFLLPLEELT
ncbi:MAG TPA: hypothetical protein PLT76_09690 [Candidatus Omnitrophota bacterium]|nr:hypothetical protein [Candidatus Omnitrophota bacterium]HPB68393.1 hypothetical protein [Candidatus Omnitrophota bacterium]HQO58973.1 hypothetical protein [Candidatus Omnitrophota bacterium]HQP12063.1 hypothetical protein [Candidatus Omnitrophota bacterium]